MFEWDDDKDQCFIVSFMGEAEEEEMFYSQVEADECCIAYLYDEVTDLSLHKGCPTNM